MASEVVVTSTPSTGEPVSAPESAPSPKRPAMNHAASTIKTLLASAPADLDAFLAHLQRCLQTPAGIDCVLQFVCYASRLSAAILTTLSQTALRRSARQFVALVVALPPHKAVLFKSTGSAGSAVSAAAMLAAQRLKALSGLLSEARVILRLWGLLGMYFWARRLVLALRTAPAGEKEDASSRSSGAAVALQWAQLAVSVLFQSLENGAFLSSKGVLGWSPAAQARAMRWSTRFWGASVGMELGRLAFEAVRSGGEARTAAWRKTVTRHIAWSPLIVHWSSEKGFVPEMGIGLLACIPSIIQMRDLWADTARA